MQRFNETAPTPGLVPSHLEGITPKIATTSRPGVLIADEDRSFALAFQGALASAGIVTVLTSTAAEASALARSNPELCLAFVDSQIPATGGVDLMQQLHLVNPTLTVILMSGRATLAAAVEAIKRGAEDYILKPFDLAALVEKVGRFKDLFQHRSDVGTAASLTGPVRTLEDFVYSSQAMRSVLDKAKKVAPTADSVLLVGERGVGKDMLARAIHAASPRARGPFFRIDCQSIAHDLPGRAPFISDVPASAVSRAALQRMFEAVAGGTLFQCEIGDLPQEVQNKLVDILDGTRLPEPGGGASTRPGPRLLASTSTSLAELQQRCLVKGLNSRVADVVLEIPPLRSRPEDIPPLAQYFLSRLGRRYDRQLVLSWAGLDLLLRYSFPGNVRELECILERSATRFLQIPRKVTDGDLQSFLDEGCISPQRITPYEHPMDLGHIEQQAIERALWCAKGNRKKAAALLGIDRTTLYSKLRRLTKGINAG